MDLLDRPSTGGERQLSLLCECLAEGRHRLATRLIVPFPYGVWRFGRREIIFDEHFKPLFERLANGWVHQVDPEKRLPQRAGTVEIIFSRQQEPHHQHKAMLRLREVLVEWRQIRPTKHTDFLAIRRANKGEVQP